MRLKSCLVHCFIGVFCSACDYEVIQYRTINSDWRQPYFTQPLLEILPDNKVSDYWLCKRMKFDRQLPGIDKGINKEVLVNLTIDSHGTIFSPQILNNDLTEKEIKVTYHALSSLKCRPSENNKSWQPVQVTLILKIKTA